MQRLQPGNDETKMRVSPRFQVHPQKYFDRYFSLPLPLPLLISTARLDRGTTWTHRKSHPAAYRLRSRQRLRAPSSLARLLRSGGLSRRRRCPQSVARSMLRVLQSSFHFLFIILLWEIRVEGGGWRVAAGGEEFATTSSESLKTFLSFRLILQCVNSLATINETPQIDLLKKVLFAKLQQKYCENSIKPAPPASTHSSERLLCREMSLPPAIIKQP